MTTNDNELRILEGVDTLKIELRPLTSLKIAKRNARTDVESHPGAPLRDQTRTRVAVCQKADAQHHHALQRR